MRSRRTRSSLWGSLGISLLLHVNVVLLAVALLSANPNGCRATDEELEPFEISMVTEEEQLKPEEKKKKLEEIVKEEKKKDDPKGQVVDLPPPDEEKRPDKARFLSDYDSTVKKETKGPRVPFKKGRLIPKRPVRLPRPRPTTPQERKAIQRKIEKQLAVRPQVKVPRSELPESDKGDRPSQVEKKPQKAVPGARKADGPKKLSLKELKLSKKELARVLGSRVNDYLKGVDKGKQTLLNSKRWRYASFFNRVKRKVAQNWHPAVVYKRRDPTGNVYGFKDRLTILRVRLTPGGKLKELHLENASGVGFLDDEAMSAFRAAEPFPNPPKGLVDKSTGMISFRFGFLFEISRRPSFRILRSRP